MAIFKGQGYTGVRGKTVEATKDKNVQRSFSSSLHKYATTPARSKSPKIQPEASPASQKFDMKVDMR